MRNTIIILLLLIFAGCSKPKISIVLQETYNFPLLEGGMAKFWQRNDTLYESHCYPDEGCDTTRHKIIASDSTTMYTILKLKSLYTIPKGMELCPGKQYSIMWLKDLNTQQFGYTTARACLTKSELDTFKIKNLPLERMHVSTYFSDSYLGELSAFKKVSSIADVREIMNTIGNNDYDAGVISYSAEELNTACIKRNFNPVGAGVIIDSLHKVVKWN